jgi:hypothetical protein
MKSLSNVRSHAHAARRRAVLERGVKTWFVVSVLMLLATCHREDQPATQSDPLVEDFRSTERTCIAAFNADLASQRANQIDELGLADRIEKDVLVPWRAIRARVESATVPPEKTELYTALRHYLEARQIAWEAYAEALRAGSDEASRPHYDVYHQKDAEAGDYARQLGQMFRTH